MNARRSGSLTGEDYLASRYQRNFVGNDCNPSAWATTERPLTDGEFEIVREHMKAQTEGVDNVGGFKLLEGVTGFHLSNLTHRDMQFLEGRAVLRRPIELRGIRVQVKRQ